MTERGLRRFLLLIIAALVSLGGVAVFSATAIMAHESYGHTWHFVLNHVIAVIVGAGLGLACLMVPQDTLERSGKPLVAGSIVLLVLVLCVGLEVGGAQRWFRLGRFSMQPSEFAKLALVLYLAEFLARKRDVIREFREGFLPPMLIAGLVAGLTLLQPDLGSAVVMGSVAVLLLALAGARGTHVAATLGVAAVALVFLIGSEEYRMRRMLAFLDPWKDPQGVGFQMVQSYIAMGHGGLVGQGLGASMQKLFFLPGAHTDFIFAIIGEELGLVGTTAVLALFALLVLCGVKMALMAESLFRKYLIAGLVGLIAMEAAVHVAVVTGLMPTKGLPLPLVSYGGTAMVSNGIACALMLRGSRSACEAR